MVIGWIVRLSFQPASVIDLGTHEDPRKLVHRTEDGRQEEDEVDLALVGPELPKLFEDIVKVDPGFLSLAILLRIRYPLAWISKLWLLGHLGYRLFSTYYFKRNLVLLEKLLYFSVLSI